MIKLPIGLIKSIKTPTLSANPDHALTVFIDGRNIGAAQ